MRKYNKELTLSLSLLPPPPSQVAAFAAEELIDMFLLEHLTRKMSFQGPRFSEKEHLSMVLDSEY